MTTRLRRLTSAAILLAWLVPSGSALALGLHLATDHHGPHGFEHERELADLVRAASHGHHHELGSADDHSHEARFDRSGVAHHVQVATLVASSGVALTAGAAEALPDVDPRARPGPADELFTAHCSLLL